MKATDKWQEWSLQSFAQRVYDQSLSGGTIGGYTTGAENAVEATLRPRVVAATDEEYIPKYHLEKTALLDMIEAQLPLMVALGMRRQQRAHLLEEHL
eukprot:6475431-Amphidinium_carterae.1